MKLQNTILTSLKKMFNAIVPIKHHSERVKHKNFRHLAGKPLFWYIIETLQSCEYIDRIYVDTDSKTIVKLLKEEDRVEIINRSVDLQGDYVPVNKLIKADIAQVQGEYFIQTHTTNPLLKPETLNNAIAIFLKHINKFDSLFSVTKLQKRFYNSEGKPVNHNLSELLPTQFLKPLYEENSCFYIFTRSSFKRTLNRIGTKPYMHEIDSIEAYDIDTEADFFVVEAILEKWKKKKLG